MNSMRERFEAWYSTDGKFPHAIATDDFDRYKLTQTEMSWQAWQAAERGLAPVTAGLLALLEELIDIEGPQPGTSDWAAKVRAAISSAKESQ